jgi:hypothetical protein
VYIHSNSSCLLRTFSFAFISLHIQSRRDERETALPTTTTTPLLLLLLLLLFHRVNNKRETDVTSTNEKEKF